MDSRPQISFGKRIGNRWRFAIEFDIFTNLPQVWNECYGSLWLWVEGRLIGDPAATEMIQIGLDSLRETAYGSRDMTSSPLAVSGGLEVLEAVMSARYGSGATNSNDEVLASLEALPRRTGPFFDGWEAVLLEVGDNERFLYRPDAAQTVSEAIWPSGTFKNIVDETTNEFEKIARALVACNRTHSND